MKSSKKSACGTNYSPKPVIRFLAVCLCLLASGCVTPSDISHFQNEPGRYLALPAGSITDNQSQVFADQYQAAVKYRERSASLFWNPDYGVEIARDLGAALSSEKSWVIVITPLNRDFMREMLSKVPAPEAATRAAVEIYGESSPELERELSRLGLERSVNRRAGDDK